LAVATCPEEFGGSSPEAVVAKESLAANSVRWEDQAEPIRFFPQAATRHSLVPGWFPMGLLLGQVERPFYCCWPLAAMTRNLYPRLASTMPLAPVTAERSSQVDRRLDL
jgi:hypothetical protein